MVTMVRLNGSVEGVIIAAAIIMITNAWRRYFFKNFAFKNPTLASRKPIMAFETKHRCPLLCKPGFQYSRKM